jgi:hypothetical protein
MFGLAWNQLAAIAGVVALIGYQLWPGITSLASKVKLPLIGGKTTTTNRAKAVESVDYLLEFFKDCPEGKAAARTCGQHLFDEHTGGGA